MRIKIDWRKESIFVPVIEYCESDKSHELNSPFFTMGYNGGAEHTIERFLKAMRLKRVDDAKVYISKNYLERIDFEELLDVLPDGELSLRYIVKADYVEDVPKGCISKSFLITDGNSARTRMFNINMLKEPNHFGKWKIYSIEREETAKVGVGVRL